MAGSERKTKGVKSKTVVNPPVWIDSWNAESVPGIVSVDHLMELPETLRGREFRGFNKLQTCFVFKLAFKLASLLDLLR